MEGKIRITKGELLSMKYDGQKLTSCDFVAVVDLKNQEEVSKLIHTLQILKPSLPKQVRYDNAYDYEQGHQ